MMAPPLNAQNPVRAESEPVFLFVPTNLADTTAPIIEFFIPDFSLSDTVSVTEALILVTGRVTEQSDSVSIYIGFDLVQLNDRQFSKELSLVPGTNRFEVEAFDSEGNSYRKYYWIYYDDSDSQGRSP